MTVRNSNNWLGYSLTSLAHIFIIVPTVYVLYTCVLRGNSLSTWHIAGFTLGCCLLMMEANLSVSGDAFLALKVSKAGRVKIHWILHLAGVVMIGVGMVTVFIHKDNVGKPHYTSNHAIVGLVGVVLIVVALLNGVMTLYPKSFLRCIGLGPIKILHCFIGLAATILMFAGQITGVYTKWWRGTDLGATLTVTAYVVGLVLVFIKPTLSAMSRIHGLFN